LLQPASPCARLVAPVHVSPYVCTCVSSCLFAGIHPCLFAGIPPSKHACTHACVYLCVCLLCVCARARVHACRRACVRARRSCGLVYMQPDGQQGWHACGLLVTCDGNLTSKHTAHLMRKAGDTRRRCRQNDTVHVHMERTEVANTVEIQTEMHERFHLCQHCRQRPCACVCLCASATLSRPRGTGSVGDSVGQGIRDGGLQ
jgi:hypothetical protein